VAEADAAAVGDGDGAVVERVVQFVEPVMAAGFAGQLHECGGAMLRIARTLLIGAAVSSASAVTVDCDKGERIGAVIRQSKPGDQILISGTCRENIVISASLHDVILDGQDKAAIIGADPRTAVIQVLGREIGIRHVRLAEGRNGINVLRGASATVDGVTIEDTGRVHMPGSGLGMNIGQHAFASVVNTTIRNNWNAGILVHENSGARIGFIDVATIIAGNKITNNGVGILVTESAQARVVGTAISRNKEDGIRVERGSHLEFADNTIEGNGGNGVTVTQNSGAIVEIGTRSVEKANRTSLEAKNAGFGLACSLGGYAAGAIGTITGEKGATSFTDNCSNGIAP
jgi:nitrous oxidase accessory protein NosD